MIGACMRRGGVLAEKGEAGMWVRRVGVETTVAGIPKMTEALLVGSRAL